MCVKTAVVNVRQRVAKTHQRFHIENCVRARVVNMVAIVCVYVCRRDLRIEFGSKDRKEFVNRCRRGAGAVWHQTGL